MNARSGRIPVIKTLLVLCVLAGATLLGQNLSRRANPGSVVVPQATLEPWPQGQPTYQAQTFSIPSNYPLDRQPRVTDHPQPMDLAQQSSNFNSNTRQPVFAEDDWNRGGSPISPQANPYATTPNPRQPNLPGTPSYPQQPSSPGFAPQPNQSPSGWSTSVPSEWAQPRYPVPVNGYEPLPPETQNLLQELRTQHPASRDEKKLANLRKELEKEFQAKHDSQVKRLEKLLSDVEQAQKILDQRDKQRAEIIDRRVAELLGQSDPLGWNYSLEANRPYHGSFPNQLHGDSNPYPSAMPNVLSPSIRPESWSYSTPDNNRGRSNPRNTVKPNSPAPPAPPVAATIPTPPKIAEPSTRPDEPTSTKNWNSGAPTTEAFDGLVALGYRWKGLKEQFDLAEAKHQQGLLGQSEFVKIKNELAASEAQWQQQLRDLERAHQLKELVVQDSKLEEQLSKAEYDDAYDSYQRGSSPYAAARRFQLKKQIAQNALKRAEHELESISEDLKWAQGFERELSPNTKDESSKDNSKSKEPTSNSEPSLPPSSPLPPDIELTRAAEVPPKPSTIEPTDKNEPVEPTERSEQP